VQQVKMDRMVFNFKMSCQGVYSGAKRERERDEVARRGIGKVVKACATSERTLKGNDRGKSALGYTSCNIINAYSVSLAKLTHGANAPFA